MPDLIQIRRYQPLDPYHHVADNGPIEDIEENLNLINNAVEVNNEILTEAIGTQGTLANRLAQSIEPDGSLKPEAVDKALHSISEHIDGGGYVRMTDDERAKLADIAVGATDVELQVYTLSNTVLYDNGIVKLRGSDSISWRVDVNGVYADVNFPLTSRHRHYYDVKPVALNPLSPDHQNYVTTSTNTAYVAGSLRVYVNGVKISHQDNDVGAPPDVKYPRISGGNATWVSLNYTEDTASLVSGIITSGKFTLSAPILSSDRIMIEFDIQLA
jgi:hypothetical protein